MKKIFTLKTVTDILKNVLVLAFWIWVMGLIYVGLQSLGGASADIDLLLATLPYLLVGAVIYCILLLSYNMRK